MHRVMHVGPASPALLEGCSKIIHKLIRAAGRRLTVPIRGAVCMTFFFEGGFVGVFLRVGEMT